MSKQDDEVDEFSGDTKMALQELREAAELGGRFDLLAAQLRKITSARSHTPAELLQREGRDER